MRIGELSCGPKKELKAFGLIFHWQQVWKERAYLKASVVGRISGSLKVWTHGQGPLNWTRGPNIHQKLGSLYQGEIASVGFTAWKTGVAELCSTIGRFPAVVRDLIKLLKLPWQSEGSVYKDPKRLTQLGLKLLWVYQWFMQCRSKSLEEDFVTSTCGLGCLPPPASTERHILEQVPGNTLPVSGESSIENI